MRKGALDASTSAASAKLERGTATALSMLIALTVAMGVSSVLTLREDLVLLPKSIHT
jgi:hypothetical protein